MIKVLFICHGNICRSPMSEFILKDMVTKRGISNRFQIASRGHQPRGDWKSGLSACQTQAVWSTALTLPVKQPAR